jgi:hypothetical protein
MYDSHSGSTAPDIWVGRIHASRLTYGSEVRLVKSYLQRNHMYRTGLLSVPRRGLVYNEVTWYPNNHGMSNLYGDITMFNDENTTTAYHYRNQLRQGYEFVHLIAHSSPWVHTFFLSGDRPGGGSVFNFEVPALAPNAAFYFINGCMCGRFTEKDCLCNWYLFAQPRAQAVTASSQLMYGVSDLSTTYLALSRDSCFGASFLAWHRSNYSSFRGTLILGDPTLRLNRSLPNSAPVKPVAYQPTAELDWTEFTVDTSNFVNGNPDIGCSQGRLRLVFDSGRIVRSDNYYTSFDGAGFARPESIAWHEYYDLFPACATDAAGRFWVAWQSFRDYNSGYDHFSLFSSYLYNGSWSPVQRIGPLEGYHDVQTALASGTDNRVWCAFKSWRHGQGDIWVSNALNGGAWSAPERLTADSLDQIDPCVTVDAASRPWVFWTSLTSGRWQLQGRYYDNGWLPAFTLDTLGDNATPRAATDGLGRVWLVWSKAQGAQSDVYYACREDSSWTDPAPLTSGPAEDLLPDIAAGLGGTVSACWQSNSTGAWDIYTSRYADGWTQPEAVTSDNANDYDPVIAADPDGNLWTAWASDRRGYWNICAARAGLSGAAEAGRSAPPRFDVDPNPFSHHATFSGSGRFRIEIYTTDGRRLASLPAVSGRARWSPTGLPAGVYLARITTPDRAERGATRLVHID